MPRSCLDGLSCWPAALASKVPGLRKFWFLDGPGPAEIYLLAGRYASKANILVYEIRRWAQPDRQVLPDSRLGLAVVG